MSNAAHSQALLSALIAYPQGAGLETLISLLPQIARRTLQRTLNELVSRGQLTRAGAGRSTIYALAQSQAHSAREPVDDYTRSIPLSDVSRELINQIRRPAISRTPVNYEREWLDEYLPNRTFYLDAHTREQLQRAGDTGMSTRPMGTYGRDILDRLLIDLSWASSRLEGNTYSRLDTEELIRHGKVAPGKNALETQMIRNHQHAIEMLVESADEVSFNRYTFLNLHGLLSENLMPDPDASGRLRRREVNITGTVYIPSAIPQVVADCFAQLLEKADQINDPFEQAFFILVHVPYLQPFEDVNKRVARIGANIAFIKHNLCPLTFVEVPERAYIESLLCVYEMRRTELLRDVFVWAYERSAQRYLQVKKVLVEPDRVRLLYREQLSQLVADIVRNGQTRYSEAVHQQALQIPQADREKFIALTLNDIQRLHEGVLVRYRLRPDEFRAWKAKQEG